MKSILCGFALKFNRIHGYKGHVWYDRYKSRIIETTRYLGRAVAYIANNPVRAGIVQHPLQYKFSSITMFKRENIGKKYKGIKKLFMAIVEKPSDEMNGIIEDYLSRFDLPKSLKTVKSLTMQDKQPGRPRKTPVDPGKRTPEKLNGKPYAKPKDTKIE